MKSRTLRIGSRGSELALWQAHWVREQLTAIHDDLDISITIIRTTGDKVLQSPLSTIGGKGVFTKELERALLDRSVDIAVHSLKDLPTALPDELAIGAITKRDDVRDVFIPHPANKTRNLAGQPNGTKIATGSLRRKAQLLSMYPGLEVAGLRGNVPTRFKKLEASDWGGMILASAGVHRLGLQERIGEYLSPERMLPAVGQGALAIELRSGDNRTRDLLQALNDGATAAATKAERALLQTLEGGCQVPIGAYATVRQPENVLRIEGLVAMLDGSRVVKGAHEGPAGEADRIGRELATTLLERGAGKILEIVRSTGIAGGKD